MFKLCSIICACLLAFATQAALAASDDEGINPATEEYQKKCKEYEDEHRESNSKDTNFRDIQCNKDVSEAQVGASQALGDTIKMTKKLREAVAKNAEKIAKLFLLPSIGGAGGGGGDHVNQDNSRNRVHGSSNPNPGSSDTQRPDSENDWHIRY